MSLRGKDKRIVDNYLTNGYNQVQAYLKENPDSGYDTARVQSSRLFAKPNIKAHLKKHFEEVAMTSEEAIARVAQIAEADISPFINSDGSLDVQGLLDAGLGFMIKGSSLSIDRDGHEHHSLTLHDSYKAKQDILKIHNKFSTQNLTMNIDLTQLSEEALERIANGEDPLKVLTSESAT